MIGRRATHDRPTASYASPRAFVSQNFLSHWRNSRLSCILHLTSFSTGIGYDQSALSSGRLRPPTKSDGRMILERREEIGLLGLTLSTPCCLNAFWRILKLSRYSYSIFASNLTLCIGKSSSHQRRLFSFSASSRYCEDKGQCRDPSTVLLMGCRRCTSRADSLYIESMIYHQHFHPTFWGHQNSPDNM